MAFAIRRLALQRPDAVALRDEHGACTWSELDRRADRLIRALRAAGLRAGDTVAMYAGNGRATFEFMVAAHHAGLRYVPVNWHFTADELAHVLQDARPAALFTDAEHAGTAGRALAQVPQTCTALRTCAAIPGHGEAAPPAGFTDFEQLIAAQADDDGEPADQCVGGPMFYTSGTNGRPKGVVKPGAGHAPIETLPVASERMTRMLGLPTDGTTLLAGPYYHSAQWAFSFPVMLAGAGLVITRRFDAATTLALIDRHRVTHVHLVPTQFIRLLRLEPAVREAFRGDSLARVWHGAAPCPPQVKRDMIAWWGPCIHEYYGSTEGAVVTGLSSQEWLERPTSVGRAVFTADVVILRDDGTEAPAGEPGTIYLRSRVGAAPQYHNDPQKTAAAYHGGDGALFTTGDVGRLDADGYLHLTDRKIDMIISGGVNIYPAEIEAVLGAHPAVQDVAVIGVPNAEFGEEVKAIVQPTAGQMGDDALAATLAQHCRATLAGYKVQRSLEFRTEFPRTETGKLQKRLLREPYWQGVDRRI
ncbi:MAG: AMP-binding protein [Burkholderiales bacterium]